MHRRALALALAFALALAAGPAGAGHWIDVGDTTMRSDIEILAAYGLIDNLTTTWPLPDGQLARLNDSSELLHQPEFVQHAAQRVLAVLERNEQTHFEPRAEMQLTNTPEVVRDFSTLARDEADVRAGLDVAGGRYSATLVAGAQTHFNGENGRSAFDGSQVSMVLGNWQIYAGEVEQWYGPGWSSSLILSNNARPFPKIGLMRNNPHSFESPWLHWLGPWQLNFFAGLLDGPRIDPDTAVGSLRLSFSPVRNLEIGLSRVTEFCGQHHPCKPANAAFKLDNNNGNSNETNEEATIEAHYTLRLADKTLSPYLQFMNEDTGPFTHAYTSYLAGASMAGPWGEDGAHWRLVAEYADSVATLNWFDFGKKAYGTAYNNAGYPDGFRYRDRTLGFSLDSDSRLLSLSAALSDVRGWTYSLRYDRASIDSAALAQLQLASPSYRNSISAQPVTINQAEARFEVPWGRFAFNLSLRAQDAKPYPESGGLIAGELGLRYGF